MTTTDDAIAAIGHNRSDDYKLEPRQHADRLPPPAAALRRTLQQPAVLATIDGYDTFDHEAVRAQRRYKRLCKSTLLVLAFAALSGLALILPWTDPFDAYLRWGAIAVIYCAMILAFISLRSLDRTNPYKRWHQKRASAEFMRGQLFRSVLASGPEPAAPAGEIALLPLQLEYFRRYHLDVQKAYYSKRAAEHEAATRAANRWRQVGAAIIVVWVACMLIAMAIPLSEPQAMLGPVQGVFGMFEWIDIAYLDAILLFGGLCAMIGYGLALAISSINNDLRNAGRYKVYAKRVEAFYARLPELRALALDPTNAGKVRSFAAEVQDLFDGEHRDWKFMQEIEDHEPAAAQPSRWGWLKRFGRTPTSAPDAASAVG
jgi:hypothetical protein